MAMQRLGHGVVVLIVVKALQGQQSGQLERDAFLLALAIELAPDQRFARQVIDAKAALFVALPFGKMIAILPDQDECAIAQLKLEFSAQSEQQPLEPLRCKNSDGPRASSERWLRLCPITMPDWVCRT